MGWPTLMPVLRFQPRAAILTSPFPARDLVLARPGNTSERPRSLTQLEIEARKAEAFGNPLAAALMASLARVLPGAPDLFERIEHWPGELACDGVIFRLTAGLHALALSGAAPVLSRLLEPSVVLCPKQLDRDLASVLDHHGAGLLGWLDHPTQTNEVARVAGLVAALIALGAQRTLPCEVLELGASAGLNLNLGHYTFRFGDMVLGHDEGPLVIAPEWRGASLPAGMLAIGRTAGVDLHPLDVTRADHRERLRAYVWPGEMIRRARLEAAIAIARIVRPQVERGRGSSWLARELSAPRPAGVRRVVFHSMVLQYADPAERRAIDAAFAAAGARADADHPLARVAMEWRADRQCVELTITRWDGSVGSGAARVAAICHPYGEWIEWLGLETGIHPPRHCLGSPFPPAKTPASIWQAALDEAVPIPWRHNGGSMS